MKKVLTIMLAFVMLFGLSLTAFAEGAKFDMSVSGKKVKAGEDVVVTVKLNNTIPADKGGTALQGKLSYDKDELTFKSVEAGKDYGYLTCAHVAAKERVNFSYFDAQSKAKEYPAGTVAVVTFTALKEMEINHLTSELKLNIEIQTATGTVVVKEEPTVSVIISRDHTWDEGKVTTEPTCSKPGVKTFTCTYEGCGETKTEEIPATGAHTFGEGKVTTEPTCSKSGVKTFTCNCGETKTEEIPATGVHTFDEGKVTTAPTCTKEGVKTFTCDCGKTKTEAVPVDADAHVFDEGKVITAPTCTEAGVKEFACTEDGCKVTKTGAVAALGHKGGEATTEKKAVCEVCGEEYGELLPEKPVTPEKPEGTDKTEGTDKPADTNKPATGDDSKVMVYAAAMIIVAGAAVVIRKKKMA